MKKQTSNCKELTAILLTIQHFLPKIKSSNFNSILIRMDNTTTMFDRKSGAQNLYMITRKMWYIIDQNQMYIKAVHIPKKLNTTDKLSHLKISKNYSLLFKF
jgi:hypothetical protein